MTRVLIRYLGGTKKQAQPCLPCGAKPVAAQKTIKSERIQYYDNGLKERMFKINQEYNMTEEACEDLLSHKDDNGQDVFEVVT